jgi:SNF2 family DNA or RNA helicase
MSNINNLITTSSPSAPQPENSKIPLWEHQKKMLAKCLQIEGRFNELESSRKKSTAANNAQTSVETNDVPQTFGIMGDKPGTGKTLTAISLILSDLRKTTNVCNLIVVPQNIFSQWDDAIKRFCDLDKVRYKTFTNYEDISKLYASPDVLKTADILLTTSLYYHMISGTLNTLNKTCGLKIGRVFFDEIDSINSMLREPVGSNFTWFISASYKGDKIGCYKLDKTMDRTCKCEDAVIDASFNLKPPISTSYKCKSLFTEMIKDIMPSKKIAELNALDFNTNIYKFVTIVPRNEKDFVGLLLRDIEEIFNYATNNIQSLMCARKQIEECGFYSGPILHHKIASIMTQVNDSTNNIRASKELKETIHARLKERQICPISLDDLENVDKVISKCCQTPYSRSITEKLNKFKCVVCGSDIQFPEGFIAEKKAVLRNKSVKEKLVKDTTKFKIDVFKDVISGMKPESKVIIFSDYPEVFKTIEIYFADKGIKSVTLDGGSITEIDKSVSSYKTGDSMVLLADSSMYGCGMNFENTTDIIFIHKINQEMEKQVIGRAQRPGRVGVLNIHRLVHPNEA